MIELPRRGTVLRLEPVELPGSNHTSPDDGTQLAMAGRRRANVARRCWRPVYLDGSSAHVGLFVGVAEFEAFARDHGWVLADEDPPAPAGP